MIEAPGRHSWVRTQCILNPTKLPFASMTQLLCRAICSWHSAAHASRARRSGAQNSFVSTRKVWRQHVLAQSQDVLAAKFHVNRSLQRRKEKVRLRQQLTDLRIEFRRWKFQL
jgi:hypothetical protein